MIDLKHDIERLRDKLYLLLLNKELTDNHVINCSQELDKLLIQYEKRDKAVN